MPGMSSKVDLYLVHAEECCLAAVRAEDNNRRIYWLPRTHHRCCNLGELTAVEATAPPAEVHGRDEPV
jgi:hypothetical protein